MQIKFDNSEEERKFYEWVNDDTTADNPGIKELRNKLAEVRKMKEETE